MSAAPTLLFVHGWGFDASFWDPLREALARRLPDCPQQVYDAGYFGTPHTPPAVEGTLIAIGHSLGALTLLETRPKGCTGLLLINGFTHFCDDAGPPYGTAPRVLDRMRMRLAQDPQAVVDTFRTRLGAPPASRAAKAETLATGLSILRTHDARPALRACTVPVRLLAGQRDPLVSAAQVRAMAMPDTHWHTGGHLLPLEDSAWCADKIEAFVTTIRLASTRPPALTHKLIHKPEIARRFAARASEYERHADVQALAATTLATKIAGLPLPARPRILEIGCGTGLLTRALRARLGPADWTVTDISESMLNEARRGLADDHIRFQVLDGEHPDGLPSSYDLICANLAVQWFDDLDTGLSRLATLLAPGGWLAINTLTAGTFHEWVAAHEAFGWRAGVRSYPPAEQVGQRLPWPGQVEVKTLRMPQASGLDFLRRLKAIGATAPTADHTPLRLGQLKAVMQRFEQEHTYVSYEIAYGAWRRPPTGVFVTGTDTGVGKTLVSAVLARAWGGDYWKPLQTGLAEEAGDTATVATLARLSPTRLHAPAFALRAPLSPWAAASLEGIHIDASTLQLPATDAPLIVEGAGGLLVPIDNRHMMLDLIARFGLPIILVARSTLGTINHTLLSLEALAARRVPVLGVILNGPPSAGNRAAIERFGRVRVLAELPPCDNLNPETIDQLAARMTPLAECLATITTPPG